MNSVSIYTSPTGLEHVGFPLFSERPARIVRLTELFDKLEYERVVAETATLPTLFLAHTPQYVQHIHRLSLMHPLRATISNLMSSQIQWYTRVSRGSFIAAKGAAGAVCQAVDDTLEGRIKCSFVAVRPPGHHASSDHGEGFCLFNNVAIGALHAIHQRNLRVTIVDFDRHHGNGTEEIVTSRAPEMIQFISSYQADCKYAGNSKPFASRGAIHVPIRENADFKIVHNLYESQVIPRIRMFNPDLIMISAGFDMHESDPLTNLRLSAHDYGKLTRMIVDVAKEVCDGKVVSVLEGGYQLDALEQCVEQHLKALAS